jgi:hypothetical protein
MRHNRSSSSSSSPGLLGSLLQSPYRSSPSASNRRAWALLLVLALVGAGLLSSAWMLLQAGARADPGVGATKSLQQVGPAAGWQPAGLWCAAERAVETIPGRASGACCRAAPQALHHKGGPQGQQGQQQPQASAASASSAAPAAFPLMTRKDKAQVKLISRASAAGAGDDDGGPGRQQQQQQQQGAAGAASSATELGSRATSALSSAAAAAKSQLSRAASAAASGISAAGAAVSSAAKASGAAAAQRGAAGSGGGQLLAPAGGPAASTLEMAEVVASLQPEGFAEAAADGSAADAETSLAGDDAQELQPAAEAAAAAASAAAASSGSSAAAQQAQLPPLRYPVWWHAPFWSGTGYSSEANNFVLSLLRCAGLGWAGLGWAGRLTMPC